MAAQKKFPEHFLLRAILISQAFHHGSFTNNDLVQLTECICPGHVLTYECTVCSEGATVWSGSLFDCTSNELILSHRLFENGSASGTRRECNNGAVTASSIGVLRENNTNCYISQLHISMITDINNKTVLVTCSHAYDTNVTVVDTKAVDFTTDIPPPEDLRLIEASPNHLTVTWTPPMSNCSDVNYVVLGTGNCGSCINTTINVTSSTCSNMSIDGHVCSLSIQTESETCHLLNKTISDPILILLKVSESPVITNSSYSAKTKEITITFNKTNSFHISEAIDGSATTYYLTYIDPSTNTFCGSTSVDASTCVNGLCFGSYSYERLLPSCVNSEAINVTVHALNVFGNGSKSEPAQISIESDREDVLLFVTVITICGVTVGVLFFIVIVTITILIHHIKKGRNKIHRKPIANRNRSSGVEERTFIMPEVLYADVGPFTKVTNHLTSQTLLMEDQKVEYSEIVHQKESVVITEEAESQHSGIDQHLNLDTLLFQISSHVTSKWYQFGQAAGIANEVLDKFLDYPSEQCVVEVLDFWLRNGRESNKRTWKDVAEILNAIGEKSLADDILNVYTTGVLPVVKKDTLQLPSLNEDNEESVPPPLPPKSYVLD